MKKIVFFTGAGISAESGLKTFRDSGGLWENYSIYDVATPEAWEKNPKLVLDFYNQRRRQLKTVQPNLAHEIISELEERFSITVITQNVDDLHERAGSTEVIHLHGELKKVRSTGPNEEIIYSEDDIILGDYCSDGYQLRPHIVWFGEAVPLMDVAAEITSKADIFVIVGTSLEVYPAAGLINSTRIDTKCFYIDLEASEQKTSRENVEIIKMPATAGIESLKSKLM